MKPLCKKLIAATLLAACGFTVQASSHREALAILNEPCADNTDTYAWVSDRSHDKLYLIMNFNPLHEPGQGNQGLRACNGYRYEFHIGVGASLKSRVIYRVEFKNTLTPEAAPSPTDPLGGGNELLWQLTGGTETMKVTRIVRSEDRDHDDDDDGDRGATVLGGDLPVLPNNHGPQTDRLIYGLGAFKGYDSGDPTSREVGLYDQPFVDTFIHPLANRGRIIAGQFDDPYQLDEKGIFDLVNLNRDDLGGIPGARRPPGKDVFTGFNIFSIALEVPIADIFPHGIPHNGVLDAASTNSLLRVHSRISRQKTQTVDPTNIITGLRGSGEFVQVGRNALPLFNAGLVGTQRQTRYLRSSPLHDVTNFGADILFPVLVRDAEALGIYKALGVDPVPDSLKYGRVDLLKILDLDDIPTPGAHHVPIGPGTVGDVLRVDMAVDSSFPNGRPIIGGVDLNHEQADVSDVLLTLILSPDPSVVQIGDGVDYSAAQRRLEFPWIPVALQGLTEGHGAPAN